MSVKKENKLEVFMLGEFEIRYNGTPVSLGKIRMSKTMELFQILMLDISSGLEKTKIMEWLYDWDETNDRNRSMNNLLYRMKQRLRDAGVIQDEYVIIKNGICKWNPEIEITVDRSRFEALLIEATKAQDEDKERLLQEAISLYNGLFLKSEPERRWILEERKRLKPMFELCVTQLSELLNKREAFQELLLVYEKAARIYPYEEWQIGQINCLQKLDRYEEAYELYEETVYNYYKLGIPLSKKMLDKIHELGNTIRNRTGKIDEIKATLSEEQEEAGAFYCPYPSFVDIYRYIYRGVERTGRSVYFMMCGIRYLNSAGRKSPNASELLCEAIGSTLRKGDVYTQYSEHQFLILLNGTQNENCEMIFERIRKNFKKKNRNSNCDLIYHATELVKFSEEESIKFNNKKSLWD